MAKKKVKNPESPVPADASEPSSAVPDNAPEPEELGQPDVEEHDIELAPEDSIVIHITGVRHDSVCSDSYFIIPKPEGWARDRTVNIDGVHYEHTHEDAEGRWVYHRK